MKSGRMKRNTAGIKSESPERAVKAGGRPRHQDAKTKERTEEIRERGMSLMCNVEGRDNLTMVAITAHAL